MPVQAGVDLDLVLADIETLVSPASRPSDDLGRRRPQRRCRRPPSASACWASRAGAHRDRRTLPPALAVSGEPTVLLLGHHDTVWPLGSLRRHPFRIDDGVLRGPGCFDMKTGVVMALHAVAALPDRTGVSILITGDEELGSPSSRRPDRAGGARLRRGVRARGVGRRRRREDRPQGGLALSAACLGAGWLMPDWNRSAAWNAAVEAAHLLLAVAELGDAAAGTSVTPTLLRAGSTTNTVPADAEFAVDVRVRNGRGAGPGGCGAPRPPRHASLAPRCAWRAAPNRRPMETRGLCGSCSAPRWRSPRRPV